MTLDSFGSHAGHSMMDFSVIDRVGLLSEMYFSCTIPPAANATEVPELPPLTFADRHRADPKTLRARKLRASVARSKAWLAASSP